MILKPKEILVRSVQFLIVGLLVLSVSSLCDKQPPVPQTPPTDTASAAAYQQHIAALERENQGLRAKIQGIDTLKVSHRTVYDTLKILKEIKVPLYERVIIREGIILDVTYLKRLEADTIGSARPIRDQLTMKNCDDKLEFTAGHVICDPARAGHITAYARLGVVSDLATPGLDLSMKGEAGLHWQPYYRSTTSVELSGDLQGRTALTGRFGLRIF
jgi:hypothetical protein